MTLSDIISEALSQLGRGHDRRSMDNWRTKFTRFANDALCDIAATFTLRYTETVQIENDGTINTKNLSRHCLKVLNVTQSGIPLTFKKGDLPGIIEIKGSGCCDVTYKYVPPTVSVPSDRPKIPDYLHGLVVTYVVARERMSGDTSTQGGYNAYMNLYELEKMRLLSASNEDETIINKW